MSIPIAIVGMGCVVPGARDARTFWENLRAGKQSLIPVPATAWDHALYYSADPNVPDRAYAELGGFVTDFVFDWRRFRVPPSDAAAVNPMQWMVLEAGAQALGGLGELPRESTAIILGATGLGWQKDSGFRIRLEEMLEAVRESPEFRRIPPALQAEVLEHTANTLRARLKEVSEDNVVGASASVAAGRINMHFDLRGPHYSVDAGFASSLAALDLAVRGLRDGEFDLAVTGGVSEKLSPLEMIAFSKLGGLSPTHLRPFDARADGTLLGEGAVLFALKRLEDAERDGNAIAGVILGVGGSSDGRGKSLVAPRSEGQALAMQRALADAGGVSADSISYVECHATGTRVGDASEVQALRQVYGAAPRGQIALGSVKANLGHLRAAAGAAGLLRATLALQHGEVPVQAAYEQPNPRLELEHSPFYVPQETRRLEPLRGSPARAAVSAFSFGGNNFHVVLEAHAPGTPRRSTALRRAPEPLALVGMGGQFPGADDVEGLWRLMQAGTDRTQTIPADRYDIQRYFDPAGERKDKSYTRIGCFLDRLPTPDASLRIPPAAWASLDPSHVLCLRACDEALGDAGWAPGRWNHDRVALSLAFLPYQGKKFLADTRTHWQELAAELEHALIQRGVDAPTRRAVLESAGARYTQGLPPITEDTLTGYLGSLNAGRIASRYDFHGPHFVVDAACASGLAAIHAASKMLDHGVADVVLAGGVWVDMMPEFFIAACRFNALSANGSFPFDARADGFIPGEGGGIAVLKRLSDAERDGDRIRAVIRGVAGSSDGRGRSVLAPSREGEGRAMRRALDLAGVSPASVEYVECHGTGTALGDVVEAGAVADVYATDVQRAAPIAIGSVKSNIGHLNAAAGVAGLFKAALVVERGEIPASLKVQTRNPKLPDAVDVVSTARPWPTGVDGGPRRAGVSTFGVGGANFHLIIEEYRAGAGGTGAHPPSGEATPSLPVAAQSQGTTPQSTEAITLVPEGSPRVEKAPAAGVRLIAVSGRDAQACLVALEEACTVWDAGAPPPPLGASIRPEALREATRLAVTATSAAELSRKAQLLRTVLGRGGDVSVLAQTGIFLADASSPLSGAPVVLTFPGQGGQYANMLRELARVDAGVRATLDEADQAYLPLAGRRLTDAFFTDDPAAWKQSDEDIHAAVLAVNVALSRLIRSFGIQPAAYLGQSAGELAALVEAGTLSFSDALRAIRARTLAVLELQTDDPGGMAALGCGAEQVPELLAGLPGQATLAADNGPKACIVSADRQAMPELVRRCQAAGLECTILAVSHGYHSELIGGAREAYLRTLRTLPFAPPAVPIISSIDGRFYGTRPVEQLPDFLASQFVEPVRLRAAFGEAHAQGLRIFLEAGPRWSLTQFARESLHELPHAASASIHPKVGELEQFQRLLAFSFVHRLGHLHQEPHAMPASIQQGPSVPHPAASHASVPVQAAEDALLALPLLELLGEASTRTMAVALGRKFGVDASPAAPAPTLGALVTLIEGLRAAPPSEAQEAKKEAVVAAGNPVGEEALRRALIAATVAKTGYPEEMLELDLDLEADLGIDTVKQVDIFATVRARFSIERDPNVALRELNTLRKAIAHFQERLAGSPPQGQGMGAPAVLAIPVTAAPAKVVAPPPPSVAPGDHGASESAFVPRAPLAPPAPDAGPAAFDRVHAVLLRHVVEKTGYPEEMLGLDLDLEADLGIDTVKQVDILARTREAFSIPREPNFSLRDVNTLRKVVVHLVERLPAGPAASAPVPSPAASLASTLLAAALQAPGGGLNGTSNDAATGVTATGAGASGAGDGSVRATLLAMSFEELGIGPEAVHRLAEALAGRLGLSVPQGGRPRNLSELLAQVTARGAGPS